MFRNNNFGLKLRFVPTQKNSFVLNVEWNMLFFAFQILVSHRCRNYLRNTFTLFIHHLTWTLRNVKKPKKFYCMLLIRIFWSLVVILKAKSNVCIVYLNQNIRHCAYSHIFSFTEICIMIKCHSLFLYLLCHYYKWIHEARNVWTERKKKDGSVIRKLPHYWTLNTEPCLCGNIHIYIRWICKLESFSSFRDDSRKFEIFRHSNNKIVCRSIRWIASNHFILIFFWLFNFHCYLFTDTQAYAHNDSPVILFLVSCF